MAVQTNCNLNNIFKSKGFLFFTLLAVACLLMYAYSSGTKGSLQDVKFHAPSLREIGVDRTASKTQESEALGKLKEEMESMKNQLLEVKSKEGERSSGITEEKMKEQMETMLIEAQKKAAEDNIPSKQEPEPEPQRVLIQEGNEPEVPTSDDANLEYLVETLRQKMKDAEETPDFMMSHNSSLSFKSCSELGINYNDTCDPMAERCLRRDISQDPRQRILDFVYSDNTFVPNKFREVIERMRQRLTMEAGKDTIIVSGCSSNHYTETQAQIKNMQETIIPVMPNIKYVLYDLGLRPGERKDLEKYGKATVLDFPFDELPEFFSKLKCFSWKVFIIAAHLKQAEILIWGDSSARFKDPVDVQELINRAKKKRNPAKML